VYTCTTVIVYQINSLDQLAKPGAVVRERYVSTTFGEGPSSRQRTPRPVWRRGFSREPIILTGRITADVELQSEVDTTETSAGTARRKRSLDRSGTILDFLEKEKN
jgi:hypothetical protein